MKRTVILFLSAFSVISSFAQSNRISFTEDEVRQIYMPPCIIPEVSFRDANHNGFLDAKEDGELLIVLKNDGGKSDLVDVTVTPVRSYPHVQFPNRHAAFSMEAGEERTVAFPISTDIQLPSDSLYFTINISEKQGYDEKARLTLYTNEYPAPKLMLRGVNIIDNGLGTRALNNNPDGMVQSGEIVWAKVYLANVGSGTTDGLKYSITTGDSNLLLFADDGPRQTITGTLSNMDCGKTADIEFRFSPNNRFVSTSGYLPLTVNVIEGSGFGNLVAQLPIELGVAPKEPVTFDIKPRRSRAPQGGLRLDREGGESSEGSTIRNIMMAPAGVAIYKNAVAVVIGAEQNEHSMVDALYATRDVQIFSEYLKKSMGIPEDRIISLTNEDATGSHLRDLFNPDYGTLFSKIRPGVTDVFVFYSGHGFPYKAEDGTQDAYLLAYDSRKEDIRGTGYSLNRLCRELNSLDAKSVTLIVDACFSGSSRASETVSSQNLTGHKGVEINMEDVMDSWVDNPNFRMMTSCGDSETSLSYDKTQSGLFTYYLALGMQGEADGVTDNNKDGSVTLGELYEYVAKNVVQTSRKIKGSVQTPHLYGNGNLLMEKYK